MPALRFVVLSPGRWVPDSAVRTASLITDNWDDWFKYSTQYSLVVKGESGTRHDIGAVKIGQFDMEENQRRPHITQA